jgi:hypothetical protein
MATSGTVTFRTNRDEIIKGALRQVGGYDPEGSGPTATQISLAAEALNLMVKAWAVPGLHLWERKYGVIFPQKSQGIFVLGSPAAGGDHACLSTPMGSGFVQTTLSASAASGASTVSVTSTSGSLSTVGVTAAAISNTYNIGIELDSGSLQWTTVSGAPSGTTVTLAATLTGAAASGNTVYCYQTKLVRPLRVLDAFVRYTGGNDAPVRVISKDEYSRYGMKTATGNVVQVYYDPRSTTGHLYVYPTFSDVDRMLFIEFSSPIEDFSNSTDDYDLPQEWGAALKFNLALHLANEYEVPEEKYRMIEGLAGTTLAAVLSYDQEAPASVSFGVDNSGR